MANGEKEIGKLDLLDYRGLDFRSALLVQRPYIYLATIFSIYHNRHLRIPRMEEKLEQKSSDLIKVVLFGPESTGKTTLSQQLARYYNTVWVPEYAREYLQEKWNNERKTCEPKDLLPIAEGQMRLENQLSDKATKILICDTDLLETKVYSEAYYVGHCDPLLEKYALKNHYDLYLLTYIDTPWVGDDLRDKPDERDKMFNYFKETLEKYDRNFIILEGDRGARLKTAVSTIDGMMEGR